jgi:hypothetical protein
MVNRATWPDASRIAQETPMMTMRRRLVVVMLAGALSHGGVVAGVFAADGITAAAGNAAQGGGDLPRPLTGATEVGEVQARPAVAEGKPVATLTVNLETPPGWKLNTLAAMRWEIVVDGKQAGPIDVARIGGPTKLAKPAASFPVAVPLKAASGKQPGGRGVVELAISGGICSDGGECRPAVAAILIPLTVGASGDAAPEVTAVLGD